MLSGLYGALAERRRRWYERRPEARRRLQRPVVSVGSLAVGGSGKTPVAADVANVLVALGERPSLLSRGYRRTRPTDGVVVVSERGVLKAELAEAGDEPFMLAGQLSDVSVLVSEDRYLAGRLAETHLGASVHVLDDGFQHLSLWRDIDLLVLGVDDVSHPRTLPSGRLRERVETARRADALVANTADIDQARVLGNRVGVTDVFFFAKVIDTPRDSRSDDVHVPEGAKALAVAGIAQPQSFVDALRAKGYDVVDLMAFRDHHPYSRRDTSAIADRARTLGADYVLTTEKDYVRLRPHSPFDVPLAWVPLSVSVEPAEPFRYWLSDRLAAARAPGTGVSSDGAGVEG